MPLAARQVRQIRHMRQLRHNDGTFLRLETHTRSRDQHTVRKARYLGRTFMLYSKGHPKEPGDDRDVPVLPVGSLNS